MDHVYGRKCCLWWSSITDSSYGADEHNEALSSFRNVVETKTELKKGKYQTYKNE